MKNIMTVIQIILAAVLSVLIFLQANDDDGRGNIMSSVTFQKRGWEKIMFYVTISVLVLFIISSIIQTTL